MGRKNQSKNSKSQQSKIVRWNKNIEKVLLESDDEEEEK